jgi:hypothetical protein
MQQESDGGIGCSKVTAAIFIHVVLMIVIAMTADIRQPSVVQKVFKIFHVNPCFLLLPKPK